MQQKTNPALPTPLTGMTGLARSIALPHDYAPQRYPSFPALERTAVMGFSAPLTWVSNSTNASERFMLTRQAAYPLWGNRSHTTTAGFWCDYEASSTVAGVPSDSGTFSSIVAWGVKDRAATSSLPGVSGLYDGALAYPVLARDGPGPEWVYTAGTGRASFVLSTSTLNVDPPTNVEITWEVWASPGETYFVKSQASAQTDATKYGMAYGAIPSAITGNKWVRPHSFNAIDNTNHHLPGTPAFRLTVCSWFTSQPTTGWSISATVNPTITIGAVVVTTSFVPLVTPVEFANTSLPWYSTRTTAASALFTNVTQVMNKAGTFLGGRVSPNVIDPFNVSSSYITTLHPAEKAQLAAEEGFYTFAPPSTDLVNFWDYTLNTAGGATACPLYRLDNDSLVNVFFHTDSLAATYSITVDWHLEFRNTSALFPIAVSSMPIETLHQAQLALTQVGYFFNNWNHEKVRQMIANIAKYLLLSNPYGRAAYGIYRAGREIAISGKPKKPTPATNYIRVGPQVRKRPNRQARRQRRPEPPPQRKPLKSGLQMYLDSKK